MLTVLEILIIAANAPVLAWKLLPVKRVPRVIDFLPSAAIVLLLLHFLIDHEAVRVRFVPLYIFTVAFFLITLGRLLRHTPEQPKWRISTVAGPLLGLLTLAASAWVPAVMLPFYPLPEPTGHFDVGTVACDFTDPNRVETYAREEGESRAIAVQFWYPVNRTGSRLQYDIADAPISSMQREYPILIFSHGAFGMRKSNASTLRELASHGYIVASIDHTYHSFYTSFSSGRGVPVNLGFLNDAMGAQTDQMPAEKVFKVSHDWLNLRTADIELVIDSLKSGKVDGRATLLKGHMDLNRIGLFGHSLGGAAAAEVCRKRDEVKAAIVLDGTMIGDIIGSGPDGKDIVTSAPFNKPLMLMYGSLYQQPEARATSYLPNISAYSQATDDAYSLCIKGSGHLNFTDLPRISPFLAKKLGVGAIDSLKCIQIMNAYVLAFFDRHLKEQTSSLLDGTVGFDEANFERRLSSGSAH